MPLGQLSFKSGSVTGAPASFLLSGLLAHVDLETPVLLVLGLLGIPPKRTQRRMDQQRIGRERPGQSD